MTCQTVCETEASISPMATMTNPVAKALRRPATSPIQPTVIIRPMAVVQKATETHRIVDGSVLNASVRAG